MTKNNEEEENKEYQEGDREPGEVGPTDDSHISPELNVTMGENSDDVTNQEGPESGQPEMVKVTIGGVEYNMPKEAADAYSVEQDAAANRMSQANDEHRDSLENVLNNNPATTDTSESSDLYKEAGELMFTDPEAAMKMLHNNVRQEVTQELTHDYNQDKAVTAYWTSFYNEHPDLPEEDALVRNIMSANWSAIKDLKGEQGRNIVADLTMKEMLRIGNKMNNNNNDNNTTSLEGNTNNTNNSMNVNTVDTPTKPVHLSLSAAIKKRKLQRLSTR